MKRGAALLLIVAHAKAFLLLGNGRKRPLCELRSDPTNTEETYQHGRLPVFPRTMSAVCWEAAAACVRAFEGKHDRVIVRLGISSSTFRASIGKGYSSHETHRRVQVS